MQCLYLATDRWYRLEKWKCLIHCHIKHIKNALTFILDIQRLTVVSFAFTYLTWNINIRQEIHLYLNNSIAATCLTSSAFHIKAETTFLVTICLRIRRGGEKITDHVKHPGIRCRI